MNQNKKIVYGFYSEIINNKNVEAIGNFLTDDFVHNGVQRGADGQKEVVKMFFSAFSNLVNTIDFSLSKGNFVCIHKTWSGKHTGIFMGVAPSGKDVTWSSTAILKIRDGKICEAWDENDFLGLFTQIGEWPKI